MTAIISQPIRVPLGPNDTGTSRGRQSGLFDLIDDPIDTTFEWTERGRDPSPKRTPLSLPSSPSPLSDLAGWERRTSVEHHHTLPPVSATLPTDPILYLPPLLSPLPAHARTQEQPHPAHGVDGPARPDPLSDFSSRLPDIDPASLVLHRALHRFAPVDAKYSRRRYDQAFNWSELTLPIHTSREWYCVVFRSRRKPSSSSLSLYQADRLAHEEAVRNGGLVMYWYGVPDETGLNLATCIWQSRRHAIAAISGPKHSEAMKQAKGAYEVYELERWVLSKEEGRAEIGLRRWEGGEVGW